MNLDYTIFKNFHKNKDIKFYTYSNCPISLRIKNNIFWEKSVEKSSSSSAAAAAGCWWCCNSIFWTFFRRPPGRPAGRPPPPAGRHAAHPPRHQ